MTDVFDQASSIEAKFTEVALANQLAKSRRIQPRESAHECGECGAPIPEGRRQNVPGCQYCTPCQAQKE